MKKIGKRILDIQSNSLEMIDSTIRQDQTDTERIRVEISRKEDRRTEINKGEGGAHLLVQLLVDLIQSRDQDRMERTNTISKDRENI